MKLRGLALHSLLFCAVTASAFSLDREAFTPTSYDLQVELDPSQHRLAVRGKITLRNDSPSPQKLAVLQLSSSLSWHSIQAGNTPLQFVAQPYRSDIDHTGALSEAIVTLPQEVAPRATVEVEISYEGVIVLDATRLTSIGTPEAQALNSDWDQISSQFSAVRGVGYVAWYPIATESADLAEPNSLFDVLARWKAREANAQMKIHFGLPMVPAEETSLTLICDRLELRGVTRGGSPKFPWTECSYESLGASVPAFASALFALVSRPSITIYAPPPEAAAGVGYGDTAEKAAAFVTDWFGATRHGASMVALPNPDASPFEDGSLLLAPIPANPTAAHLMAVHHLTHAAFSSPNAWISEGLAHFAQALYIESQQGRQAALSYMQQHRLTTSEFSPPKPAPAAADDTSRSLLKSSTDGLDRTKAMYVWWMLRDLLGDGTLKRIIASYRPDDDKDAAYVPHLIQEQARRDLQWFFDDWVDHDRSLPSFKIASAFARKNNDTYLLTLTVENNGSSGAEVPVRIRFAGGDLVRRVEIRAHASAVVRVDLPKQPQEVIVNDGSVPESGETMKPFKIEVAAEENK